MPRRVLRISDIASDPRAPQKGGLLPVSPATIWRWSKEGKFPKPFKLGRAVTVWDANEVEAFIAQQHDEGAK